MTQNRTIPVKYIFLDVVAYSNRSIEAQCYIVETLNGIVRNSSKQHNIDKKSVLYIPTGDGVCIALLDVKTPYDIHVKLAKQILKLINSHNEGAQETWRKFEVRIGINQLDDVIIEKDINRRLNLAGAGINEARRIMDLADASQILVSNTVYANLHAHKEYLHAFSQKLIKSIKHDTLLECYQFVQDDVDGLNLNRPLSFQVPAVVEPKLPKRAAYYIAHAIKNEEFIKSKARESTYHNNWLKMLLFFLAKNDEHRSETKPSNVYCREVMPDTGEYSIEGIFNWFYKEVPGQVAIEICDELVDSVIPTQFRYKYFDVMSDSLIVNSDGKQALKEKYPDIWKEFNL